MPNRRPLGTGEGGFYTPSYSGGGELRLKMMCLGKHWDPRTAQYEEIRFAVLMNSIRPPTSLSTLSFAVAASRKE